MYEFGYTVHCSITVDPAAAVACNLAGVAAVLHCKSIKLRFSTGPFPGMDREIRLFLIRCQFHHSTEIIQDHFKLKFVIAHVRIHVPLVELRQLQPHS